MHGEELHERTKRQAFVSSFGKGSVVGETPVNKHNNRPSTKIRRDEPPFPPEGPADRLKQPYDSPVSMGGSKAARNRAGKESLRPFYRQLEVESSRGIKGDPSYQAETNGIPINEDRSWMSLPEDGGGVECPV